MQTAECIKTEGPWQSFGFFLCFPALPGLRLIGLRNNDCITEVAVGYLLHLLLYLWFRFNIENMPNTYKLIVNNLQYEVSTVTVKEGSLSNCFLRLDCQHLLLS